MSKISVDLTQCQGYANCVATASEVFDLTDSGVVKLLKEMPAGNELERARQAASLCPVQAITISD